jgi:hypothetical protein
MATALSACRSTARSALRAIEGLTMIAVEMGCVDRDRIERTGNARKPRTNTQRAARRETRAAPLHALDR